MRTKLGGPGNMGAIVTQPVESRRLCRWRGRSLCLAFVWGITAIGLWWVWPMQPRLTLGNGDDFQIVGITSDSEEVVALTRRAVQPDLDENQFFDNESGPIQVWNLKSGNRRSIGIPGQSNSGVLVEGWNKKLRMLDPEGWRVQRVEHPLRGRWLQFDLIRGDKFDDRQPVMLNLDDGGTRVHKPKDGSHIELSPMGRWYAETWTSNEQHRRCGVRVFETASGKEQFAFEGTGLISQRCFSPDDFYFGCTVVDTVRVDDRGHGTMRIWRVESGEIVQTIDQDIQSPAFSRSHQLVAGSVQLGNPNERPRKVAVLVWDVDSGNVVHRGPPQNRKDSFFIHEEGGFEFVENDKWLLCHSLYNSFDGQGPFNAQLNLKLAWNLVTGERVTYSDEHAQGIIDPNFSENGILPDSIPSLFTYGTRDGERDEQLFEITTGRPVFTMPENSRSVRLTRDGRTLVLERYRESQLNRFLTNLQHRGLPIPGFVWSLVPHDSDSWSIVDVPSRRTIATMPAQERICWLSPDERTLVTISLVDSNVLVGSAESPVINVWDFPPRKPLLRPFAWSLLVPLCFLLWPLCKRCCAALFSRRRLSSQSSTSTGAADDVTR